MCKFEIFALKESSVLAWNKVGGVKALPLPMACMLTGFVTGQTYHIAIRPVDVHGRVGDFSVPKSIEIH